MAADAPRSLEIRPEGKNPRYLPVLHPAQGSIVVDVGSEEELAALLARYANAGGYNLAVPMRRPVGRFSHVHLYWPAEPSAAATPGTVAVRDLHDIAERVDDGWFLRPLVGSARVAPHLLLRWWGLLLALSSLARYHPAEWVNALDVDCSALAVDLEQGLATAEWRLPELIAAALGHRGDPPNPVVQQRLRDAAESAAADARRSARDP